MLRPSDKGVARRGGQVVRVLEFKSRTTEIAPYNADYKRRWKRDKVPWQRFFEVFGEWHRVLWYPVRVPKRTTSRRTWTEEQLREAVKTSRSIRKVLQSLGLRATGGNYCSIQSWIKELKIDTSHFLGQGWCKQPPRFSWDLVEILVENSLYTNSGALKRRLMKEGVFSARCQRCGLAEWLGQAVPLELEHINGVRTDNRRENLQLLCPNCHAFTPTYRRRKSSLG